jgi:hypothetical protein
LVVAVVAQEDKQGALKEAEMEALLQVRQF